MSTEINFNITPECGSYQSLDWAFDYFHRNEKASDPRHKFLIMCAHKEKDGSPFFHEVAATVAEYARATRAYPGAMTAYNFEAKKEMLERLSKWEAENGVQE